MMRSLLGIRLHLLSSVSRRLPEECLLCQSSRKCPGRGDGGGKLSMRTPNSPSSTILTVEEVSSDGSNGTPPLSASIEALAFNKQEKHARPPLEDFGGPIPALPPNIVAHRPEPSEVSDSWLSTEICGECVANDPKALDPAYKCHDCGKNVCATHYLTKVDTCGNFIPTHYGVVPRKEFQNSLPYANRPVEDFLKKENLLQEQKQEEEKQEGNPEEEQQEE